MTSEPRPRVKFRGPAAALFAFLLVIPNLATAQGDTAQPAQAEMQVPGGTPGSGNRLHGIAGEITVLKPTSLELRTLDKKSVHVNLSDKTKYRKERQPVKLSDFKVGDVVFVGGEPGGNNVWNAEVVATRSDRNQQSVRDALGKLFIVGEIKSIKGTNLIILRPDGVTQIISVDENTSFRKDDESITLADFKPGDHVFGRGEVKNQIFVPIVLAWGEPRFMMPSDEKGPR